MAVFGNLTVTNESEFFGNINATNIKSDGNLNITASNVNINDTNGDQIVYVNRSNGKLYVENISAINDWIYINNCVGVECKSDFTITTGNDLTLDGEELLIINSLGIEGNSNQTINGISDIAISYLDVSSDATIGRLYVNDVYATNGINAYNNLPVVCTQIVNLMKSSALTGSTLGEVELKLNNSDTLKIMYGTTFGSGGKITIAFPNSFTYIPIVFADAIGGNSGSVTYITNRRPNIYNVTVNNFSFTMEQDINIINSASFPSETEKKVFWIAIGV